MPLVQVEAGIVHLDDGRHQTIDAHGHGHRNGAEHHDLGGQRLARHDAQCNHDDFSRQDEVGANGPLDLVFFKLHQIDFGLNQGLGQRLCLGRFFSTMGQLVPKLFAALVAKKEPAQHQKGRDRPGGQGADEQRCWHQDGLVEHGALGHGPHHGNFAFGTHAGHLLRIQRQVVAQHARGLFGRNLGQDGDVVQNGGDVVQQCQQTCSSHGLFSVNIDQWVGCASSSRPARRSIQQLNSARCRVHPGPSAEEAIGGIG